MPKSVTKILLCAGGGLIALAWIYFAGFSDLEEENRSRPSSVSLRQETSSLPEDTSTENVSRALDEGSIVSLQALRPEFLGSDVGEPTLKEKSLQNLIRRFELVDWKDWPNAAFNNEGGPTEARRYLDDIYSVNQELGSFLETAAQLLHELYVNTAYGKPYNIEKGLQRILQEAEELLKFRKSIAIPARSKFEASIAEDPVFIKTAETIRAKLVASYLNKFGDDLKSQLALAKTLRPEFADAEIFRALTVLLYRIALQTSSQFREEVFGARSRELEHLAEIDVQMQRALGELYLIRAIDLLEDDEAEKARSYYEQAIIYDANSVTRKMVGDFLSKKIGSRTLLAQGFTEEGRSTNTLQFRRGEQGESTEAITEQGVFFYIMLGFLVLLSTLAIIYFYRINHARMVALQSPPPIKSSPQVEDITDSSMSQFAPQEMPKVNKGKVVNLNK